LAALSATGENTLAKNQPTLDFHIKSGTWIGGFSHPGMRSVLHFQFSGSLALLHVQTNFVSTLLDSIFHKTM
jgi:hypothetical protein